MCNGSNSHSDVGPGAEEHGRPLATGKGKDMDLPLSPQKEAAPPTP